MNLHGYSIRHHVVKPKPPHKKESITVAGASCFSVRFKDDDS